MTPDEHARELVRLRGRVARARAKLKAHTGPLVAKLALKAAVGRAEAAVRAHSLAFHALTESSRLGPLLTEAEARAIAHWVCTHDTGVQPAGEAVQSATGWSVRISSTEVTAAGVVNTVRREAYNYADARAILGY